MRSRSAQCPAPPETEVELQRPVGGFAEVTALEERSGAAVLSAEMFAYAYKAALPAPRAGCRRTSSSFR